MGRHTAGILCIHQLKACGASQPCQGGEGSEIWGKLVGRLLTSSARRGSLPRRGEARRGEARRGEARPETSPGHARSVHAGEDRPDPAAQATWPRQARQARQASTAALPRSASDVGRVPTLRTPRLALSAPGASQREPKPANRASCAHGPSTWLPMLFPYMHITHPIMYHK